MWVTGSYDRPPPNQIIWGNRQPGFRCFDGQPTVRATNLYTNSVNLLGSRERGKMNWYFPVHHARRSLGLRTRSATHIILIDGPDQRRGRAKVAHPFRPATAFSTRWSGRTGRWSWQSPYVTVNWTKGIDQKTGRPVDYEPPRRGHPDNYGRPTATPMPGDPDQAPLPVGVRRQTTIGHQPTVRTRNSCTVPALNRPVRISTARLHRSANKAAGLAWRRAEANRTAYENGCVGDRHPLTLRDQGQGAPSPYPNLRGAPPPRPRAAVVFTAFTDGTVMGARRHLDAAAFGKSQRRAFGFNAPADDVRSGRQAIPSANHVGSEPGLRSASTWLTPELQGAAQPDHAVSCFGL